MPRIIHIDDGSIQQGLLQAIIAERRAAREPKPIPLAGLEKVPIIQRKGKTKEFEYIQHDFRPIKVIEHPGPHQYIDEGGGTWICRLCPKSIKV